MKQSELMTLRDGLAYEFNRSKNLDWEHFSDSSENLRMDEYVKNLD